GSLVAVSVRDAAGALVPASLGRDGTLRPAQPVPPGTKLLVEAVFRRPGWVSWIAGRRKTVRLTLTAPIARLETRWLRVKRGAPLLVSFDRPVRKVEVTGLGPRKLHSLRGPARIVRLGRLGDAGTIGVSAVAEAWERLPQPTTVTWFPPGKRTMLLVSPRPGSPLAPDAPLRLRFSTPVSKLLRGRMPSLDAPGPGRWQTVDPHTLEFTPRGYGFGLGSHVRVKLPVPVETIGGARAPTRTIGWTTPPGSELRLEQLLAQLGYLPVRWTPAAPATATTVAQELTAAVDPPTGTFDWRYPNTPSSLTGLWHPGRYTIPVRGAVMAFEDEHGLPVDGFAGRRVWQALIADTVAGKHRDGGYSYVYVHLDVPQSLNLWH